MNIVDLSLKRPIMISMALLAFVIFGFTAYFSMPLTLIPDVKMPTITVQTIYAGASPEVIESQISRKIEDATSSLSGIDEVQSYSMDSASIVMARFDFSKDENLALQEVKDKVDQIVNDLPADAEKPVVSKISIATMTPIINIVLEGDMTDAELYTFAKETVANKFAQVAGVSSVDIAGGAEREIKVNFDSHTVYERKVSILQIAQLIAAANKEIPGGNIDYDNRDIPVQFKGTFQSLDDLNNLDIPTASGIFKLHQLADVDDTSKTVRARTILLDKKASKRADNAILLQVIKNPSGNTVEVVENILALLPEIEAASGGHIHLNVINEDGTYVKETVADTLSNVYLGIALTALVLLVFLHDWRATLIVAITMPFCVLATFFVMQFMGIGFNLLSLTGISSATGSLVANSVVVLENVFKHKNKGLSNEEATSVGSKEVLMAVFASTLTNVAVFLPIGTINNSMGSVLGPFAITSVIATVFSIVASFTLTPMLCKYLLPKGEQKAGKIGKFIDHQFFRLQSLYQKGLYLVLKNKVSALVVLASAIALFVVSLLFAGKVGFELLPTTDGGKIQINIELSQGSDLEHTAKVFQTIEERLSKHDEVEKILTNLGSTGSTSKDVSLGQMMVYLVPKSTGRKSSKYLSTDFTRELSDIAGAKIDVTTVSEITFAGLSFGLDLYLKGDDQQQLQRYAEEIKSSLNAIPGFTNVNLSSKSGKQELSLVPNRMQISQDALTVQEIALTLRAAIDGLVLTTYKENNIEYDVRVTVDENSIKDLDDLKNIPVVSKAGCYPLSRYADISFENSSNMIMRVDKNKMIEITADVLPGYSIGNLQSEALREIGKIQMLPGYEVVTGGTSKEMTKSILSLVTAFATAILIIYMLLAATLEDLKQPVFILATVPLSIVGVILSAVMTGAVINIVAMLGIIMLVGIVVNNAILILDQYNLLRREQNMRVTQAMVEACGTKLKAILMSNIAIILGQLPMALGIGASGAEMRQPMGIIIMGGIISSTVMTLFVVPSLEKLFANESGKKSFVLAKVFKRKNEKWM